MLVYRVRPATIESPIVMELMFRELITESLEFNVNCIPEIHGILNMPQVLNIPRF